MGDAWVHGTAPACLGPRQRPVADMATELGCDETVVWLALDRLGQAGLLEKPVASPWSRRELLRTAAALGLLAALPAVSSIIAPTPAMAQSGRPPQDDDDDDGDDDDHDDDNDHDDDDDNDDER